MATFEKIDRATIAFDKKDIKDYNISGGTYSASLSVTTTDGKTFDLKFDNNDDLKDFIENIIQSAMNMDWTLNYPGHWRKAVDDHITLEDIKAWNAAYVSSHVEE